MIRAAALLVLLLPSLAHGQEHHMMHHDHGVGSMPRQPGQGAFAAIQEIVAMLEADPATDWSKVRIDALRQHLVDMDNVTLHAAVKSVPIEGGMKFTIAGTGEVRDSIHRMVVAHASAMNGTNGWHYEATNTAAGAVVVVHTPAADIVKLRGLGFMGLLASGMHHQHHHLMIARGENPHH